MIPETISIAEAMDRYKCDRKPIMQAITSGAIETYRPGKAYQVVVSSGDEWFASTRVKPAGRPRSRRR